MATNSNPGLSALKHFGLDPNDFTVAGGDSVTFVPCYDNKVCLPLSVIVNLTDECHHFRGILNARLSKAAHKENVGMFSTKVYCVITGIKPFVNMNVSMTIRPEMEICLSAIMDTLATCNVEG